MVPPFSPPSPWQVIQALTLVKAECTQLLKGCLFNLPKTRTMRLEDFEDMQLKVPPPPPPPHSPVLSLPGLGVYVLCRVVLWDFP